MTSKTIEQILTFCDEYTPCDPPEYFFDHNPETFPGWFYLLKQRECPIQIKENLMKFMQVPNFHIIVLLKVFWRCIEVDSFIFQMVQKLVLQS